MNEGSIMAEVERESLELAEYYNDLDRLLDIRTVEGNTALGLHLTQNRTLLIGSGWHWYLVGKHPTENTFKIVGLNKSDNADRLVYILGVDRKSGTPFLTLLNNKYLRTSNVKKCLKVAQKIDSTSSGFNWGVLVRVVVILIVVVLIVGITLWLSNLGPSSPGAQAVVTTTTTTTSTSTSIAPNSLSTSVSGLMPVVIIAFVLLIVVKIIGSFDERI
jgi:hypothetical protein